MEVKLKRVRLAFPALFAPKAIAGNATSEPRFSAAFVIEPGSANAKALKEACVAVAKEKWKDKAKAIYDELEKKDRIAYKEGPLTKDGVVYDGFEGMHVVNASNKARPTVVNRDRSPLTEKDGLPYAGSYVNAILDIWAQDNQYGKRINCSLSGVQFAEDGDAFGGGRPASADAFDDLGDGSDAGEMSGSPDGDGDMW